jgi:Protein of unknown function (DUF2934)
MIKERVSRQATSTMSVGTPRTSSAGEKAGPVGQTSKEALTHDCIAQLAYDLYEQRGRQEGRALEDWLNAELQLVGVLGQS